jgi:DNA-binding transcriptional regulator YiaG
VTDPKKIKEARLKAGLTQTQAAELVHSSLRSWQHWESGARRMDGAHWELFLIKTGQDGHSIPLTKK